MTPTAAPGSVPAVAGRPLRSTATAPHPGSRSLGWWGLVFLIATEATLFGLLIFVNFYLRANASQWPLGAIEDPELKLSGIRSVILLGSTVPIVAAERAARQGDQQRFRRHLGIAFTMGAVFLAGHVQEYVVLLPEFTWRTNAYGSIYYTLTGLHALHLAIGLAILGYLFVQSRQGRFDDGASSAPECGTLYWHFVDAVWVAVYATMYLSVTLS